MRITFFGEYFITDISALLYIILIYIKFLSPVNLIVLHQPVFQKYFSFILPFFLCRPFIFISESLSCVFISLSVFRGSEGLGLSDRLYVSLSVSVFHKHTFWYRTLTYFSHVDVYLTHFLSLPSLSCRIFLSVSTKSHLFLKYGVTRSSCP